jgi:hypothetical protein
MPRRSSGLCGVTYGVKGTSNHWVTADWPKVGQAHSKAAFSKSSSVFRGVRTGQEKRANRRLGEIGLKATWKSPMLDWLLLGLVREFQMFRKTLIALAAAIVGIALVTSEASARGGFGGFHGGGFHGGFAGAGWRGGGWGGWHGAGWGWRGRGWGWGPAVGVGIGLGVASAAWGPWGWGPGWGWGPSYGWGDECTTWRRVWTGWGWRLVPVNVCW